MTIPPFPHFAPSSWGLVFAVSAALVLWLVSLRTRDVSVVDIFWGLGVAGVVGPKPVPNSATLCPGVTIAASELSA